MAGGVGFESKACVLVGKYEDRGRCDECFQFPESRFFRSGPSPRFLLFSQAVEGAGYMREVRDEPMVEVYKAHEGLNLGDVLIWGRPVPDTGNFDGIHFYTTFGED